MEPDEIVKLLVSSMSRMDAELQEKLIALEAEPGTPVLLIRLLLSQQTEALQKAELTYLFMSVKAQYKYIPEEAVAEINENLLSLIDQTTFYPSNYELITSVIAYVYNHVPDNWVQLFDLMNGKIQNQETHLFGLNILHAIVPYMKSDKAEEMSQYLFETCYAALMEESPEAITIGVCIYEYVFSTLKLTVNIMEVSQSHLTRILEVSGIPAHFSEKQFSDIWRAIGNILKSPEFLSDEIINAFVEKDIEFAGNGENQLMLRSLVFSAIRNVISHAEAYIENILNISMDLCALTIEENGTIDESQFTEFEAVFYAFPHEAVFPLVQQCVTNALESESVSHQVTALIVFRVLITNAPDCAHKDISTIVTFLEHAISCEEEPILQEASCLVLSYFSQSFSSLNCHSPKFIPSLIQLIVSENSNLRIQSYHALEDLLENLDSTIEDLFTSVIQLLPQIPEDDLPRYIKILSLSISGTEDFDDEMCDAALEIISRITDSDNIDSLSPAFDLGLQIIKHDNAQIESVNELLLPLINQHLSCLPPIDESLPECEYKSAIGLIPAVDYIGGLTSLLREEADEKISDYLDPIIALISKVPSDSMYCLYRAGLRACAQFVKHCESKREALLPMVYEGINFAFQTEKPSVQKTAIECVLRIRSYLSDEQRFEFFQKISEIIKSEVYKLVLISHAFKAIGKLIVMAGEMMNEYMTIANEICELVMNASIKFLQEKPLIDSGSQTIIFESFCSFCCKLLDSSTPITDEICAFLLQWIEKDDEIAHFQVTGALIATVRSNAASQEMMQQIFDAITRDISSASDPSLQQNITYFLNLLVQRNLPMINEVMGIIPAIDQWYQNAKGERFGYQDLLSNIGSLYLTLAAHAESFDAEKIAAALEEFPPYDVSECSTMVNNILLLVQRGVLAGQLAELASIAIARFIVWDESNIEKALVPQDQTEALVSFLRDTAASNRGILNTLEKMYAKTRGKYRKIAAILQ